MEPVRNNYYIDVYEIGGYGTVLKCIHKGTKDTRAVKIILKSSLSNAEEIRLKYEIDILKNLDHPNILRLYEVFEDKISLYLVTEYCEGGELFDAIAAKGKFEEKDAAHIIKQILSAISFCHS